MLKTQHGCFIGLLSIPSLVTILSSMKFSVAPLSTSAASLAVPHAYEKVKGMFIELFSLIYMMHDPNAQIQAG